MTSLKLGFSITAEKGRASGRLEQLLKRLQARLGHPPLPVSFKVDELTYLNENARAVMREDPMLIEIQAPIKVVGDTHGQFYDLLRLFDFCGDPSQTRYIFLGDYVDRGELALESLCLLLALKIRYPHSFWLLRGNHESSPVNQIYGFYDEMRKRFGAKRGTRLWLDFCHTFNYLPMAAVIGSRVLCMHGGLSPNLKSLDQIRQLPRPSEIPDYGLMCDIVWSDPEPTDGWGENPRGLSFSFGNEQIKDACRALGVDLIVRGHQMVKDGWRFSCGRRMLTVFSAPNYADANNAAAVLNVNADLSCSFEILRPDKNLPCIYITNELKGKKKA